MNVMVLASDIPATTNMPGSPRLFSLSKGLSQHHDLTLVTLDHNQERYQSFLGDPMADGVYRDIINLPGPPKPTWWRKQVHRLRRETHFVTRYRSPEHHAELCRRICDTFRRGRFDVIFADGLIAAQYLVDTPWDCPAVIDLHDSLTLLYSRAVKTEPRWSRKLALLAETHSIERWERSLSRRFGTIITNSEVDERFLRSLDPSGNFVTIANGVDSEYFVPDDGKRDVMQLVFTGVMDYGPNEDSVVYFCDAILPLIQGRYPQAQFWIVGKDPTERVQLLAGRAGVHVTGGVPDVRPYLSAAGIFVCPLRFGAGVKNKVLAALAMGKAVVATGVSLEGLDLREDEHVIVADEPGVFAAQVIRLIEDPELAACLGRRGQALVKAAYSWERSGAQLDGILRGAAGPRA